MTDKTNAGHDKQAVDANTGAYWADYFGEYGKQWVRTIPRRVASALISRTASKDASPRAIAELAATATVRPVMPRPVITDDRVFLEATLDLPGGDRRLFCAEFDHGGKLLGLDALPVPTSRIAQADPLGTGDLGDEATVPWPPEHVDIHPMQFWWSGQGDILYYLATTHDAEVSVSDVESAISQIERDMAKVQPHEMGDNFSGRDEDADSMDQTMAMLDDLKQYLARHRRQ